MLSLGRLVLLVVLVVVVVVVVVVSGFMFIDRSLFARIQKRGRKHG
jgi:NADH:ubiquinone oxidoreductase subunit H